MFHQGVKVILFDKLGRVLMLYRDPNAYEGNSWTFSGGGMKKGEHPDDAIKREMIEEIGICPDVVLAKVVTTPGRPEWEQRHLPCFVYVGCKEVSESDIQLGNEEQQFGFFPLDHLPAMADCARRVAQGILL